MKSYTLHKPIPKKRWHKILIGFIITILIIAGATLFTVRRIYTENLKAVDPVAKTEVIVAIPEGASLDEITNSLKTKKVIRADWAFKQYVRSSELGDLLQAGTYRLNTAQDVPAIVKDLTSGRVAVDLFTILPGQRIDQIREAFIDGGFNEAAVDKALLPSNYAGMAALVDKPADATLEGYLYPDSFQKTADTQPETIIRASLTEMGDALTTELRKAFAAAGLTTYQAITLASIVEREVSSQVDRAIAAQVFFKRIKEGIPLQSDVTVIYGMAMAGEDTEIVDTAFKSPYNTFLNTGLPIGPISNVTKSGLQAVARPANTDYLYFVAGDGDNYGKTYFTKTLAEHKAAVNTYCNSCSPQ